MPPKLRVVALIAAYNEEDIIRPVVADLIGQGVEVYVLDHGSTDGTPDRIRDLLGHGLLRIERFPEESGFPPEDAGRFAWTHLLTRKTRIAAGLDADWFIHHDADEFRESPWPEFNLSEAIAVVDGLGYNAIDFEVLHFLPIGDGVPAGSDVRDAMRYCERAQPYDKRQIKCWKQLGVPVDLASSGGHEAEFPGRQVFPLRFLLRHYPIRSQAHGERKVFAERRPRFVTEERDRGWHVQYDDIGEGYTFVRDPGTLMEYDPVRTRIELSLRHRGVEQLERDVDDLRRDLTADIDAKVREIARSSDELQAAQHELTMMRDELGTVRNELGAMKEELGRTTDQVRIAHELTQELHLTLHDRDTAIETLQARHDAAAASLSAVFASRSWRATAPLRALGELMKRRRAGGQ